MMAPVPEACDQAKSAARNYMVPLPDGGDLVLVVGPEGGLDETELAAFADAGATAVRLGAPVLRTSTAGSAALTTLSLRTSRWN